MALSYSKKDYQRKVTFKHHGDFYYLNYLHSFSTENKRKKNSHKKIFENKNFCNVVMPSAGT